MKEDRMLCYIKLSAFWRDVYWDPQRISGLFFLNELLIDMMLLHVFSDQPVIYHPDMNIGLTV